MLPCHILGGELAAGSQGNYKGSISSIGCIACIGKEFGGQYMHHALCGSLAGLGEVRKAISPISMQTEQQSSGESPSKLVGFPRRSSGAVDWPRRRACAPARLRDRMHLLCGQGNLRPPPTRSRDAVHWLSFCEIYNGRVALITLLHDL